MDKFIMKTHIHMGSGALQSLTDYTCDRAFIVCDPFMKDSGMVNRITDLLEKKNIVFEVFAEVRPNPDLTVVQNGLNRVVAFRPDAIISLGGGSAIDVAKALDFMYRQYDPAAQLCTVAVPTTSGTGSEVTSATVITNQAENVKIPFADPSIIPNVAILDPDLTKSVPPAVKADTGMDVFTHAIEAYVARDHNDFTDAGAEKAMRLVWTNLEKTVRDQEDEDARTHMHNASCLAGLAFNEAGVGLCHSMAHALGESLHISHGRANAVLLPYVIAYNAKLTAAQNRETLLRYEAAANALGIYEDTPEKAVRTLVGQIRALEKRIGIPQRLSEMKINIEDFNAALEEMTEHAFVDPCNDTNPIMPSRNDILELFCLLRDDYAG